MVYVYRKSENETRLKKVSVKISKKLRKVNLVCFGLKLKIMIFLDQL